jgi:hypothetical protein
MEYSTGDNALGCSRTGARINLRPRWTQSVARAGWSCGEVIALLPFSIATLLKHHCTVHNTPSPPLLPEMHRLRSPARSHHRSRGCSSKCFRSSQASVLPLESVNFGLRNSDYTESTQRFYDGHRVGEPPMDLTSFCSTPRRCPVHFPDSSYATFRIVT